MSLEFSLMLVLHVNWARGALRLWAESVSAYEGGPLSDAPESPRGGSAVATATRQAAHPFAAAAPALREALVEAGLVEAATLTEAMTIDLLLPADASGPMPSDRLAQTLGVIEPGDDRSLTRFEVPAVGLVNEGALSALLRLEDRGPASGVLFGHALRYWIAVARFVIELLADQRFIPTLLQPRNRPDGLQAAWEPWLHDDAAQDRVTALLSSMPPVVRAVAGAGEPWIVLQEALTALCDATVRSVLIENDYADAVRDRDPQADPQVAWLNGLLAGEVEVKVGDASSGLVADLLRDVRSWLSRLETGATRPFRLCFRLGEGEVAADAADVTVDATWRLSLHLLLEGDPPVIVDTARVWSSAPTALLIDGHRIDRPQEALLAELGRASRIYPRVETALAATHPSGIDLTTAEAAEFLGEYRDVLEEAGFAVMVPEWFGRTSSRLGLRLRIDSPTLGDGDGSHPPALGLDSLVQYQWEIAVGDQALLADQLSRIAGAGPLVCIGGRWVENPARDLEEAAALVGRESGGEITLRQAIRMADGAEPGGSGGLPILGMDAHGWVGRLFDQAPDEGARLTMIEQPRDFNGTLRPYQKIGLSWLAFLEQFGLGACLADDMGLGKTIQLIALLLYERRAGADVGPTLLVVPTSLIENWVRELKRFAPALIPNVHHGPQRRSGEEFTDMVRRSDVVITTYALVPRDRASLGPITWHRVVLDEAQYIKNPPTQQTTAIRELKAERRVALTGTPVENRLTELWSIMEFCNPGYLGPAGEFRRRCAVPIERHRDRDRAEALRRLVQPFILRRLKSDPRVIVDLPPCVETKEFATLTGEQASLYQSTVDELLASIDSSEGIERRGRVLAALTRLKQVCNHPAHLAGAVAGTPSGSTAIGTDHGSLSARSGKCRRLMRMLEELLAADGRALIFTQYRRMGDLLSAMIRADLDCEVQFMHGGTPGPKRQAMIDRFQSADGGVPVFILSLKTGGVGLNLTAANHVFHFDRWWNPAVEKQATDRAFRIGQTRAVHVHKFVCAGTLEERIDRMIEQKIELADNVIGSGEQWLTELSTQRLAEVLQLRAGALEIDA